MAPPAADTLPSTAVPPVSTALPPPKPTLLAASEMLCDASLPEARAEALLPSTVTVPFWVTPPFRPVPARMSEPSTVAVTPTL